MASRSAVQDGALEAVARNTIQEQIYQQLRNSIMSGVFQPGQPLSTRTVAEAVGVSVMPVRDALRRLEVENALVVGHNRTLEVPRLTAETLDEIYHMRVALEGLAAERSAALIQPTEIGLLDGLSATMANAISDGDSDAYLQANWAFHRLIYRCAAGDLMMSAIESLWLRMGPYFRLVAEDKGHLDHAMSVHEAIVSALIAGDGRQTRLGVVLDIQSASVDVAAKLDLKWTGADSIPMQ